MSVLEPSGSGKSSDFVEIEREIRARNILIGLE